MKKSAGPAARAPMVLMICAVVLAAVFSLNAQPTLRQTFSAAALLGEVKAPPADAREAFLLERTSSREKERAALCAILEDESASQTLRQNAEDMLLGLSKCAEYETRIEAALCGMRLTGLTSVGEKSAYVFVDQALTKRQAALLFAAVSEITGFSEDMIRVSDGNAPETKATGCQKKLFDTLFVESQLKQTFNDNIIFLFGLRPHGQKMIEEAALRLLLAVTNQNLRFCIRQSRSDRACQRQARLGKAKPPLRITNEGRGPSLHRGEGRRGFLTV